MRLDAVNGGRREGKGGADNERQLAVVATALPSIIERVSSADLRTRRSKYVYRDLLETLSCTAMAEDGVFVRYARSRPDKVLALLEGLLGRYKDTAVGRE